MYQQDNNDVERENAKTREQRGEEEEPAGERGERRKASVHQKWFVSKTIKWLDANYEV